MPKSRRPSEKLSETHSKRSHSRSRSRSKAPSNSKSNNSRRRDNESREHSECTEVLSPGQLDFQPQLDASAFQLPSQLPGYKHLKSRLLELNRTPTKKKVIEFIQEQIRIKFSGVRSVPIVDHLEKINSAKFWEKAIPHMIDTIISSPLKSLKLLKSQTNCTTTLTRLEAYTVLSHMFFATLIAQGGCDIANFCYLFSSVPGWRPQVRLQKLKCYVCYFQMMCEVKGEELNQIIIFQRVSSSDEKYRETSNGMVEVQLTKKNIEEFKGQLMVDFANMIVGGGFLKNGAVQQEILFVVCPQLGITRLICEIMEPNDSIVVHGFRQYSEYEGYAQTFKFKKQYFDKTPLDVYNKCSSSMIAVDALDFSCFVTSQMQYEESFVLREIHKAYVGFGINDWIEEEPKHKKSIITGKWGCGAFKGDPELKFIIQWLACSWINRKYVFVNWGEDQKNEYYEEVISHLKKKKTAQIVELLTQYAKYRRTYDDKTKALSLFGYLKQN